MCMCICGESWYSKKLGLVPRGEVTRARFERLSLYVGRETEGEGEGRHWLEQLLDDARRNKASVDVLIFWSTDIHELNSFVLTSKRTIITISQWKIVGFNWIIY